MAQIKVEMTLFLFLVTILVNVFAAQSISDQPDVGSIEQVAWSPDGAYIAAASDTHLVIYTPDLEIVALTTLEFRARNVQWWGGRIVSTGHVRSDEGSVQFDGYLAAIHDLTANGLERRLTLDSTVPVRFDVFADSIFLGVITSRGWTVYDEDAIEIKYFSGVVAAEPSPDETRFALVSPHAIDVVEAATWRRDKTFSGIDGTFHAAAWGANGLELAGVESKRVIFWDVETGIQRAVFARRGEAISWERPEERYADVEPTYVLSVGGTGWIMMADIPHTPGFSMLYFRAPDGHTFEHRSMFRWHSAIRIRPDKVLVKGTNQQGIGFWMMLDTDTGNLFETELLEAKIWLNPVLPQIVTAQIDSRAFKVLDRDSLTQIGEFEIDARLTYSIDFSPGGMRFVSAHGHDGLRIWDISTGQIIASTTR